MIVRGIVSEIARGIVSEIARGIARGIVSEIVSEIARGIVSEIVSEIVITHFHHSSLISTIHHSFPQIITHFHKSSLISTMYRNQASCHCINNYVESLVATVSIITLNR